jgi:hypothetical protein
MNLSETRKTLRIGTIALWIIFGITTITMIALIIGEVFPSNDIWIPIIPIGILLILAGAATVLDIKTESNIKLGIVALWTFFLIILIVFTALILGRVFTPSEYWIPMIPIGIFFVLAIIPTILEYSSGDVRFCSKCGKRIQKKWEFCQDCGNRILISCPSCGKKIKGNPKYCHRCGLNLEEIEIVQTPRTLQKYKKIDGINICNNCGTPIETEAKFCGLCGAVQ